jgi:hypothetical protein
MNTINYTRTGGLPLDQEGLDFMQKAYTESITAIGKAYGNKVILEGMAMGGSTVAEGTIVYNGEVIKFIASPISTHIKISETSINVEFEDGLMKSVYNTRTAVCDVTGDFEFSELIRIEPFTKPLKEQYDNIWVTGDIKMISCTNEYRNTNFDLSGMGRLERLGWKICNGLNDTVDFGGRVPIGYDGNTVDPHDNVWDVAYNTLGQIVGEKKHQLSQSELPENIVSLHQQMTGITGGGGSGNQPWSPMDVNIGGNGTKFSIVQPSLVVLFIQKI